MARAVLLASAAPKFNAATGGTYTTYSAGGRTFARHTFTSSGTFTVTRSALPFTIALFGGGGGSGGAADDFLSDSGGQGGIYAGSASLSVQSYAVTVGTGGAGGLGQFGGGITDGGYGGDTILAGVLTAGGGGKGGGGFPPTNYAGRAGSPSPAADGYADPIGNALVTTYGLPSTIGNGGPSVRYGLNGVAGNAGALVVEYQIG